MQNLLIKGDNIDALDYLIKDRDLKGKIDLVYIDPPFATNGRASTISNSKNGVIAYSDKLIGGDFIEYLKKGRFLLKNYYRNAVLFIYMPIIK
jgi:adenine-specific DNA-methyltransferase